MRLSTTGPAPGTIEGQALPGIAGVLQAQHNTLADLGHFPSAYNLRHLLVAQADLAQTAARFGRSVESATAAAFDDRAGLYRQLVSTSRTLGGDIGDGRFAALESANAARRFRSVMTPEPNVDEALAHLLHIGTRIDARVAAAVEHGFREKLYFVAINLPTLGKTGPDGIVRAAQKYIPVDSPAQSGLLALVRERLQPVHRVSGPDRDGVEDRRARLSAAVDRHMSTYVSSTR